MATRAATASNLSTGAKVAAVVFWGVGITLGLLIAPIEDQPGNVWVLRVLAFLIWVGMGVALILREKRMAARGEALDRDTTAFDLWTIPHTWAGVVFGIFGLSFPFVAGLTILWEVFEWLVPGFGETESLSNRVVDVAVAWGAWLLVAGAVALITQTPMPWLLPPLESIVR